MTSLPCRLLRAGVLAIGVTGCGPSLHYSSHHGHHHHHHGGAEAVGLAAGFIVGAAVAASAAEREPPPEPVYYAPVYYGPPPPAMPRSSRDVVQDDVELPPFDPQAARAALTAVDVSSCRDAGAPSGFGHAKVVINPDGRISKVVVDEPPGMEAAAAKCIGDRIGTATVAPFKGSLVTMGTTYHVK